jgi:hypothetical protein
MVFSHQAQRSVRCQSVVMGDALNTQLILKNYWPEYSSDRLGSGRDTRNKEHV